jgi:hypothetical protein
MFILMDRGYPLLALDIAGLASKKRIAAQGARRFTASTLRGDIR